MPNANGQLVVAILAVPESTASTLYGMHEILESPGRDWAILAGGTMGRSRIAPIVVSATGEPFQAANGLWVHPHGTFDDCPAPDVIAVPDLAVAPGEPLAGRYAAERVWLRSAYADGASVAAACTGALVLAEAGLLDGQDATTHWAYCDSMAQQYPAVRLHPARALVISGEGRLILAGGGTSWHDLALYLIARFVDAEEAMRVARLQLLDWHHAGQQPFAALTCTRQVTDAVVARCQEWAARHFAEPTPVAGMVAESGLAERSFKRRFVQATGMAPIAYVHTLRLETAKQRLETTDIPVEVVAAEIGYEDASFFGRLFRRRVGLTPAQYRRRFGGLRRSLDGASPRAASRRSATHRVRR
jgi:transcriptional regulator GlxA family with amidase domain